jgi:hypothetical protein
MTNKTNQHGVWEDAISEASTRANFIFQEQDKHGIKIDKMLEELTAKKIKEICRATPDPTLKLPTP